MKNLQILAILLLFGFISSCNEAPAEPEEVESIKQVSIYDNSLYTLAMQMTDNKEEDELATDLIAKIINELEADDYVFVPENTSWLYDSPNSYDLLLGIKYGLPITCEYNGIFSVDEPIEYVNYSGSHTQSEQLIFSDYSLGENMIGKSFVQQFQRLRNKHTIKRVLNRNYEKIGFIFIETESGKDFLFLNPRGNTSDLSLIGIQYDFYSKDNDLEP